MKTSTLFKTMALMAGLVFYALDGWGQGFETFDNSTATGSYGNGSFTGDDGFTWSFVHSRNEDTFPIDGKGLLLRRSDEPSSLSATIPGGIGNFSVDTRKAYTGNTQRKLELVINGDVVAQHEPAFGDGGDDTVIPFIVEDINVVGNVNLILRMYGATGNQQITLDNISWTGYTSGVIPPSISNIYQSPESDITSADPVGVSAEITEGDAPIAEVALKWGTASGVYLYEIEMVVPTTRGTPYTTQNDIPGQPDGTTVYYVIYAEDENAEFTISPEQSYEVRDARFTTLPYEETFDSDLGDTYVYSVSGDNYSWIHSSFGGNGYAQMNGFGSIELEEDWLILPGIDLDAYTEDVLLSFETAYNFGTDDENNYLKLFYSTDYAGIGDPTSATWTELAFTKPTTGNYTWQGSGSINLSSISGTIWIGFKYHYSVNYRLWRVDNINIFEASMPVLAVSPEILSGFTYVEGSGPSASQSFEVSGLNLDGSDVTITAPADFEVSEDEIGSYGSTVTLTDYDGSLNEIWVRLASELAIGEYSGNIAISGGGATAKNVAVNGSVAYDCGPLTFPFYENFNYAVGSKLVDFCWAAHSGAGTNSITVSEGSITYPGYLSSGIGNQVTLTTTGEDVHRQFLAQTSGTVYVSFLANITSATTTGDYFFHVSQSPIGTFKGRVFVKKDETDKLAFGIAQSTSSANYSTFDYDLNTTYLIVLRHEIIEGASNDVSSIYINPPLNMSIPMTGWISNTDASGTDLTELGTVALRKGTAANAPGLILDGLRVSNDWADIVGESSAPALLPDPTALSEFTYIEGSGPSAIQSFTLTGENLSENVVLTKPASYEISTVGGESFTPETSITLIPVDGSVAADIYVRLQAGLTVGAYNEDVLITWEGDNFQVGLSGTVTEAVTEPSNHVTDFAAAANSSSAITVTWTDSDATAYLVKGSIVSFEDIVNPVDGIPESDGSLVQNVAASIETHQFTGLDPDTDHFFKIFPYNGSGATINYKTDEPVPQASANTDALPAGYFVDFEGEGETKGSYDAGTVNLSGLDWDMTAALIGTLAADFKNGERSARMRGYGASSMTMLENKSGGIGEVSFFYRRYGTDAQVDWKVEYSADNGVTWTQIGADFTAPASDDVQTFSEIVNIAGDVRIRIKRATEEGASNLRLNIDDILITDFEGVPENLTVTGITLGVDDTECYDATNNITVTNTTIGNGASAEFRAGVSINFGEGFVAESGSYVLAVITDVYCTLPPPLLASEDVIITAEMPAMATNDSFFKVYPNPTSNAFTLELTEFDEALKITVEIYGMMGERLLQNELFGSQLYQFDMSTMPKGVYILRIMHGGQVESQRIIKQ
jgi:hypothetical protein